MPVQVVIGIIVTSIFWVGQLDRVSMKLCPVPVVKLTMLSNPNVKPVTSFTLMTDVLVAGLAAFPCSHHNSNDGDSVGAVHYGIRGHLLWRL